MKTLPCLFIILAFASTSLAQSKDAGHDADSLRPLLVGKDVWLIDPTDQHYPCGGAEYSARPLPPISHYVITEVSVVNARMGDGMEVTVNLHNDSGKCFSEPPLTIDEEFSFISPHKAHPDWSKRTWTAIAAGKVFVGMNKDQVKLSLGKPSDINTTTSRSGSSEQWVYDNFYLYFDGTRLTTIQN